MKKPKVIIITGSTATGKSSLGIFLAKKIGGEVISADSRQIYKGLENFSGTEKIDQEGKIDGVKHHLLSVVKPGELFTASDFKKKTEVLINEITSRGRTPIIVGGAAFYINSILYKNFIPKVEPNQDFRDQMDKLSLDQLGNLLKQKDEKRYSKIDLKNRRRVTRSLEVINSLGYFPEIEKKVSNNYDISLLEIYTSKEKMDIKIENNFRKRISGMIQEADYFKDKISENVFYELGLAYKNIFKFWSGEISINEFTDLGIKEEQKYAKRQKTFLKKLINEFPGKKKRLDVSDKFLKIKTYIFTRFNI